MWGDLIFINYTEHIMVIKSVMGKIRELLFWKPIYLIKKQLIVIVYAL